MIIISTSPTGRFEVRAHPWEPRMSHTILPPLLFDTKTTEYIYAPDDSAWSVDRADWEGESVVRLSLRKYPGGKGTEVELIIDCLARTTSFKGKPIPLSALNGALKKAVP